MKDSEIHNLDKYEINILLTWEEVYKKGQLTFWILLSLRFSNLYMQKIKEFINSATNGMVNADDKSMYRALRRLEQMDLISHMDEINPNGGAARKIYTLTDIGQKILQKFIDRNILNILFKENIIKLMKGIK